MRERVACGSDGVCSLFALYASTLKLEPEIAGRPVMWPRSLGVCHRDGTTSLTTALDAIVVATTPEHAELIHRGADAALLSSPCIAASSGIFRSFDLHDFKITSSSAAGRSVGVCSWIGRGRLLGRAGRLCTVTSGGERPVKLGVADRVLRPEQQPHPAREELA